MTFMILIVATAFIFTTFTFRILPNLEHGSGIDVFAVHCAIERAIMGNESSVIITINIPRGSMLIFDNNSLIVKGSIVQELVGAYDPCNIVIRIDNDRIVYDLNFINRVVLHQGYYVIEIKCINKDVEIIVLMRA